MRDPLLDAVETWTKETLETLVGRRESHRFEFKDSDLNMKSASGRRQAAESVAALASAAGGVLILGAQASDDEPHTVSGFPGLELDESAWRDGERSIQERVRPWAAFTSNVLRVSKKRVVVVVTVEPHPLGLPVSADGRFFARVNEESKPMPWDEVRRRFQHASQTTGAVARSVQVELGRLESAFAVDLSPPLGVGLAPLHDLGGDLRTTGPDLVAAVTSAVGLEKEAWSKLARRLDLVEPWSLESRMVTSQLGVDVIDEDLHPAAWQLSVNHSGMVLGVADLAGTFTSHGKADMTLEQLGACALRLSAVGVQILRSLGVASPLHVLFRSGVVGGLIDPSDAGPALRLPGGITSTDLPMEVVTWGSQSALDLYQGARLLAQRVLDALGTDKTLPDWREHQRYLEQVLGT